MAFTHRVLSYLECSIPRLKPTALNLNDTALIHMCLKVNLGGNQAAMKVLFARCSSCRIALWLLAFCLFFTIPHFHVPPHILSVQDPHPLQPINLISSMVTWPIDHADWGGGGRGYHLSHSQKWNPLYQGFPKQACVSTVHPYILN